MSKGSWNSQGEWWEKDRSLKRFVERVLKERGEEVAFIVLFGSRARGDWSEDSDYDVLIGLKVDDGKRLPDRIYEFSLLAQGPIEPFVYSKSEIERMKKGFHFTLLEALADGIVLYDDRTFGRMREEFKGWLERGLLVRTKGGWRIGV